MQVVVYGWNEIDYHISKYTVMSDDILEIEKEPYGAPRQVIIRSDTFDAKTGERVDDSHLFTNFREAKREFISYIEYELDIVRDQLKTVRAIKKGDVK